jgi:clan AA aspartic protease (TIGR02281 family)
MKTDQPPDLDQLFGSTFVKAGIILACLLIGYLVYKQATRPEMEIISANEVRLQQQSDGHYHIAGAINGQPVRFMLDTGASLVTVSDAVARRAGLECEQPASFTTANGEVKGCVARQEEVAFGGYRLFHIDVAIMPNMGDMALLGMNALGKFNLQQTDGTLVISHKPSDQ